MNNERKFFTEIANTLNPGWNVRINDASASRGNSLTRRDALVYVVDVATGWTAAGALERMSCEEAVGACRKYMALIGNGSTRVTSAADLAGQAIALCGAARFDSSSAEVELALATAAAAMVETRTYQIVVAANAKAGAPPLAGHWIYLAYRMKASTDIVTRPAYMSGGPVPGVPAGRFLSPEALFDMSSNVIRGDLTNAASLVGSTLASGGGAVLAPRWRTSKS